MRNILVTGGSGFIGSHLIARLSGLGYKVTCLEKPLPDKKTEKAARDKSSQVHVIYKDLSIHDASKGLSKNFDCIVHLAGDIVTADFIRSPENPFFNNISSTLNLLEDIRINNPRCILIFASTEKIYSGTAKKIADENTIPAPIDNYALSKLLCEQLIKDYHETYGTDYVIFRSANVFGPGQKPVLFIPSVISQIARGKKIIKIGNLLPYRNFIYIDDLITVFISAINRNNSSALNEIFNLSSYNLRISQVLGAIAAIAKKNRIYGIIAVKDRKLVRPSRYEAASYAISTRKANRLLKWKPQLSFEDGLSRTFLSYLNRKEEIK